MLVGRHCHADPRAVNAQLPCTVCPTLSRCCHSRPNALPNALHNALDAGGEQPDLQVRFVPAPSTDPDGVGSYVLIGQLAKLGIKYPSGFTFQVTLRRPWAGRRTLCCCRIVLIRLLGPLAVTRIMPDPSLIGAIALGTGQ